MRGYRKKPLWIYIIGIVYFILPFVTLLQLLARLDFSFSLLKPILLSEFFLWELLFSVTAGLAVLSVSRIGFFYLIILSMGVLAVKIYNLRYYPLFESSLDALVIGFWFLMTLLFLFTALRIPFLNPRLRWWRQPGRYRLLAHGAVWSERVGFPVITLDFSVGGCFVKLDERVLPGGEAKGPEKPAFEERRGEEAIGRPLLSAGELEQARAHLDSFPAKLGERVRIVIETLPVAKALFPSGRFESEAEVVWTTRGKGSYRYGLGLKFIGQRREDRRRLKQYLRIAKKAGIRERERE